MSEIDTGIVRHTNLKSLGRQNEGNRRAYEWFDPVIRNRINELADIVTDYFDTMLIDATRIYIDKRTVSNMANDLNRSIKLYIDGSEATNKIDLVKKYFSS